MKMDFYIENINFFCYYHGTTCKDSSEAGNVAIYDRRIVEVKFYCSKIKTNPHNSI